MTVDGEERVVYGKDYWKEENVHYHLLKFCIYGADIDSFAVQLTTINLLLKDLENFTDDLNIIECDSLIEWEKNYDWKYLKNQLKEISFLYKLKYKDLSGIEKYEEISRERAEKIVEIGEFWDRNFDYIVGNPPYGSKISSTKLKKYYMSVYNDVHMRTIDVFNYFISRATKKTKNRLGYIVPSTLLTQFEHTNCRKYLLENYNLNTLINLGENVFEDNSYPTMIIVLDKITSRDEVKVLNIFNSKYNEVRKKKINNSNLYLSVNQNKFKKIDHYKFLLLEDKLLEFIVKVKNNHDKLRSFCNYISVGVASGNDKAFVIRKEDWENEANNSSLFKPLLVGGDIERYKINYSNKQIIYINRKSEVDTTCDTVKYLKNFKTQLSSRREVECSRFAGHGERFYN